MNNKLAPSKRLILVIYLSITLFIVVVGIVMGFWVFRAPLLTIFFVVLAMALASIIGALVGWLILIRIYPQLRNEKHNLHHKN
jgi:hypothetical protein